MPILKLSHFLWAFQYEIRKDSMNMRLDKFLKVSRIIKRRTVANEACAGGRVSINGKTAKPGAEVHPGDVLSIRFGERVGTYEVLSLTETVRKNEANTMYRVLSETASVTQEREQ